MKKVAISMVFSLLIVLGPACKKCETCTQTVTTAIQGDEFSFPQTVTTNFEACDDELESIDGQTISSMSTVGGVTTEVTTSTVCN